MEYIKEFIKYKESKGEKAIYRVNDTRGYTYYSDDYVKWLEQQLRIHNVVGQGEQCAHEFKFDYKSDNPFDLRCEKCGKKY